MYRFLLTCPRGLEEVTAKDVAVHIKDKPQLSKGGILFNGSLEDMYRVNLYSRTGMYLLKNLFTFKAKTYNEIYKKAFEFNWQSIITHKNTFSIRTNPNQTLLITQVLQHLRLRMQLLIK